MVPAELFFNTDTASIGLSHDKEPVWVTQEGVEQLEKQNLSASVSKKKISANRFITFIPLINARGKCVATVLKLKDKTIKTSRFLPVNKLDHELTW